MGLHCERTNHSVAGSSSAPLTNPGSGQSLPGHEGFPQTQNVDFPFVTQLLIFDYYSAPFISAPDNVHAKKKTN